jgi:large subunit ribosomal protein L17
MRHGKKFNHLSRKAAHRKSMLANMACSLVEHKRIKTTLAKAKALRIYIEPLITKSKNDTTHSRRVVFSYLKQKQAITELFGEISSKVAERNGGYTRILKLSNRLGDNAQMCFIEFVDYNIDYTTNKPSSKKSRRRGGKKTSTPTSLVENSLVVEEGPIVEDSPVVEDALVVEEDPIVEDSPVVEDALVVEEGSIVEDSPVVEDVSVVEEIIVKKETNETDEQKEDTKD